MSAKLEPLTRSPTTFGIFGPTGIIKFGIDLKTLQKTDIEGAELEFCTDELSGDLHMTAFNEDKYFDSPDMLKCSYFMDELLDSSDGDISSFSSLAMKMKDIISDGKVKKLIIEEGVGVIVPENSQIRAHYHMFLEDMTEPIDSSYTSGKVLQVTLNKGMIVAGLDIAIQTMRRKERSRFLVEAEYAYGKLGCPPRIPPQTTILFDVELLGFADSSVLNFYNDNLEDRRQLNFDEVLEAANTVKAEGNALFNEGQYSKAIHKFMNCINAMEAVRLKNDTDEMEMIKVISKSYQNVALCNLKLGIYGKALAASRKVLGYDPNHPKALYILGKSLRHIGEFQSARKYLLNARRIAPASVDVMRELKLLDRVEDKFHDTEMTMCKKMFQLQVSKDDSNSLKQTKLNSKCKPTIGFSGLEDIIYNRLSTFEKSDWMEEIKIPICTFTQHEVIIASEMAETMNFGVELIDKPGKQKSLRIIRQ